MFSTLALQMMFRSYGAIWPAAFIPASSELRPNRFLRYDLFRRFVVPKLFARLCRSATYGFERRIAELLYQACRPTQKSKMPGCHTTRHITVGDPSQNGLKDRIS